MDAIFSYCKENFQLITLLVGLLGVLVSVITVCVEIKKKRKRKKAPKDCFKLIFLYKTVGMIVN